MRFTSTIKRKTWVFFGIGISLPLILTMFIRDESEAKNEILIKNTEPTVFLSTSTIPVLASGVVEAADSTTVYAETAGVVKELLIHEGTRVTKGQVMLRQSAPIAEAKLGLIMAQADLSALTEELNGGVKALQAVKADTGYHSAEVIALLRQNSNNKAVAEAVSLLQVNLEQNILATIGVVDYVNNNRELFSASGLDKYYLVVNELYGDVPKYFANRIARPVTSGIDIQLLLEEAKGEDNLVKLETVTILLNEQLISLAELFKTGEVDVFNRYSSFVTDDEKAEYLKERGVVLSSLQSLVQARQNFSQVVDGVAEDLVGQDTNVAVSETDKELAELQKKYAEKITAQTAVVSKEQISLAEAELSLATPRAPFTGVVSEVLVDQGQYVMTGTPLLVLVGQGAKELVVTIPAYLLPQVKVGQRYVIDGAKVGVVKHFSAVSNSGVGTVVVGLIEQPSMSIGTTLRGVLELEDVKEVYQVPRAYVHFDSDGLFLWYQNGQIARAEVVYDAGQNLYLKVSEYQSEPLLPAVSISI